MKKGSHHSEETKKLFKTSNKESIKKASEARYKDYKHKHPRKVDNPFLYLKSRNLLRDFNMSLLEYNELFERQDGCCAVCGIHQSKIKNMKSLCVDHNHDTGKIRGLLCDCCNRGIGLFNDDIELLDRVKVYLAGGKYGKA